MVRNVPERVFGRIGGRCRPRVVPRLVPGNDSPQGEPANTTLPEPGVPRHPPAGAAWVQTGHRVRQRLGPRLPADTPTGPPSQDNRSNGSGNSAAGGRGSVRAVPLGADIRTTNQRAENNPESTQPSVPLDIHPSRPSAWAQRQDGGGADLRVRLLGIPEFYSLLSRLHSLGPRPPDLCVRPLGVRRKTPVSMGREQIWIGPDPQSIHVTCHPPATTSLRTMS